METIYDPGFLLRSAKDIPNNAEDDLINDPRWGLMIDKSLLPTKKKLKVTVQGKGEAKITYTNEANIAMKHVDTARINALQNVTRVIVNAYYRGGSSILGKLISFNPRSFYLFEPFTKPFRDYKVNKYGSARGDVFVEPLSRTYV